MKCTDPSQNAKNPPPECALLNACVQVSWFPVNGWFNLKYTWASAQFELHISGPKGLRTPIQVAARQNLSRSPMANVLLVPSVICFMEIALLPKNTPVLLQRG